MLDDCTKDFARPNMDWLKDQGAYEFTPQPKTNQASWIENVAYPNR
jgi:hypothetical protein